MIGFKIRSFLGKTLGTCVSLMPVRENTIARLHLKFFLPALDSNQVIRQVYQNICQSVLESLNLKPILKNHEKYIEFNDLELAHSWLNTRKGIVCLTAHTGNWDLLAAYMALLKFPLTVIGKDLRNKFLNRLVVKLRENYGVKLLLRADKRAVLEIQQQLKSGNVVAALIDQDTKVSSASTRFFGMHAITPSSLVSIAKKCDSIIVYTFIVRTGFTSFKIFVGKLDSSGTIEEILNEYNKNLEEVIRQYPSQWVWFHKRWRTTQEMKTMSSSEYLNYMQQLAQAK